MVTRIDRRLAATWLPPLGTAICAAGAQWLHGQTPLDDAYITFRYAWHLTHGHGLVYNPGEAVMGSSSPGFSLALALLALVGLAIPTAAACLTTAGASACSALAAHLLRREGPLLATCAGLAVATNSLFVTYSASGMETPVYAALLLGALVLLDREGAVWPAGLCAGLACLVRPEGLAAVAVLGTFVLWRRGMRSLGTFAAALACGVAPWAVFAVAHYGSALPQSVVAKLGGQGGREHWVYLIETGGLGLLLPSGDAPGLVWVAWLAPVGIAVAAVRELLKVERLWINAARLLLLAHLAGYGYAVARDVIPQPWYMAQLIPLWAVAALPLLAPLATLVWLRRSLALTLGLSSLLATQVVRGKLSAPGGLPFMSKRAALYVQVAGSIRPFLAPGDRIAAPEIGGIGWGLLDHPLLDTAGLVSPATVQAWQRDPRPGRLPSNEVHPRLLEEQRPRWLIGVAPLFGNLPRDPWFQRSYTLFGAQGVNGDPDLWVLAFRLKD